MAEFPIFSIITINLNNVLGLSKTIESVVNQSFDDFEYIIIDGGSTDGSIDVIRKYADRITFWVSESDKGIYEAMNKGILQAKGNWIGIINSGDWYEQNALDTILNAAEANTNMQIIHGVLRVWQNSLVYKVQGVHSSFLPDGMIEHPATFVRKDVFQTLGLFDIKYHVASDYDFMCRAYLSNINFLFIDRIISNYVLGGISCTSSLTLTETLKIKQLHGFLPEIKKKSKLADLFYKLRRLFAIL